MIISIPNALKDIYRIALKKKSKVESIREGDNFHVWSRSSDDGSIYVPFWAVLSPGESVVLDEINPAIGWKIHEMSGISIVNPRAIGQITKWFHRK